jgi:hypothetical protein
MTMSNETEKHCMCGCIYLESDCPNCNKVTDADRIEELEAKLAKAVEALVQMVGKKYYADDPWGIARTTLAELKGETEE